MLSSQSALQATQYIIDLFEKSKGNCEDALESLPGIYAVIDEEGNILKGNRTLATHFGVDHEYLLERNFNQLMSEQDQLIFRSRLSGLPGASVNTGDLRCDITRKDGAVLNYLWTIGRFKLSRPGLGRLFAVVGRDVTDLTSATVQRTRMQNELNTARMVQEQLFLEPVAQFGDSSVCGFYQPANECGGDWWHYSKVNNKIFLWVGDVTGHGVSAALVVAAVNAVVTVSEDKDLTPAKALRLLNRVVFATARDQLAMTFFVASIDLETRECVYASAGHEPAILLTKEQREYSFKTLELLHGGPSFPLGTSRDSEYTENKVQLKSGDRVCIYTDGLQDLCNPEGDRWGSKFFRSLAPAASKNRGSQNLVQQMKLEMNSFRKGVQPGDDATFVAFQIG